MAGVRVMMHHHVDRFVQLNRALGKKFAAQEISLRAFADFAEERSITHLTAALILEWAGGAATPDAAQARFDRARALAVFLHAEDARHEIPAMGLLGRSRRRRPAPHILTQDQISRIMQEALLVPGLSPISPLTYHNLFGLLASTGLRISEALSLQRDDLTAGPTLDHRQAAPGQPRVHTHHPHANASRRQATNNCSIAYRPRVSLGVNPRARVSVGRHAAMAFRARTLGTTSRAAGGRQSSSSWAATSSGMSILV